MLRNRNRNGRDFMGYGEPSMPPQMTVSKLEPKDERLLDLSEQVGQLGGQNDMLNEDNRRLEDENQDLRKRNAELVERNTRLESEASADRAGFKSASDLVDEIEAEVKKRKEAK